jgi:RHS repeat-associated protein
MLRIRSISFGFIVVLILALVPASIAQQGLMRGQSSTLLPGGRTLLLGGFDSKGVPVNDASVNAGGTQKLVGMNFARSGHSATVLPDGTVFIFGGIGPDNHLVTSAELFDPATQQFTVLADVLAIPRAFHTATLLTDGTVLLAGGIMVGGQLPDDVQLWDYRSKKALSFHSLLMTPRQGHTAALLSDGAVVTSHGTDHFGRPVLVDEIYDPVSKRFRFSSSSEMAGNVLAPAVAASIPADGADGVTLQDPIALRFTQLLNVTSVTDHSFVLTGPDESVVRAKVTAAEAGRLVFVLPQAPLQLGTTYVLRLKNVTDTTGRTLPEASISFQTVGQPPDSPGPDWVPNSTWTDNSGITRFQELPALQASSGVTALSGQILRLNGWPLQHVTLEIDGRKARTDSTGRFLLQGLTAGHHVLWIDGSTANNANASYGVYEVGTTITANKTNVLNYTVWMTRLDTAHSVSIPSPINTETVITNPFLPGLELRLSPGSVITDRSGKTVRQISITPVPLNKPPFPLPTGVEVPLYFTIQPGGAYISVRKTGTGQQGARLIYPNAGNLAPGAPFEFWNYDADAKGWYIYGLGKVSADARSVLPDPGVVIYEFTGAMVGPPGYATPAGRAAAAAANSQDGDPVELSTGQFIYTKTDLSLTDTIPVSVTRTYVTNDSRSRAFGIGTTFQYDIFMVGSISPYDYQELILPDGGRVRFDRISPGTNWTNALYVHASSGSRFYGALLSPNTDPSIPGFWKLVLKDGTILSFPESSSSTSHFCQAVVGIQDRYGNRVKLDRNGGTSCRLTKVTSPNGRYITFAYDFQGRINQSADSAGRTVSYSYDSGGRLSVVTDVANGVTTYTYDDQNRMLTIKDPRNIVYLTNEYDSAGRVTRQTQADGGVYQFAWTAANGAQSHNFVSSGPTGGVGGSALTRNGCWGASGFNRYDPNCGEGYMALVSQVDVTDPRGYVRRVQFNPNGYISSDTYARNQPEQQTVNFDYYADNILKSVTDPLGRKTTYDYDANGNLTRLTRLDGTSNAVTTGFTYESQFNHLITVTDALNHTTTFNYDSFGNLTSVIDPLSHTTTFTYNGAGQIRSVTDALNNAVQFGYFAGDLVTVTDPTGNISTSFYDAAGRVISTVDAQGQGSRYQYNPLNLLTQMTDPQGNITTFSYDLNGNLMSLTDALNHTTAYTYDNMDRMLTRTDPLLRQESYTYDLHGNLASSTDRKGQTTSLTYDPLNRPKLIGYNMMVNGGVTSYESTIDYTYDAASRMTQVVDSSGGTITEAYNDLDLLTTETTPQGSITYDHDVAGRRTSMTVPCSTGSPACAPLSYTYDNANRLTQLAQGASTIHLGYDDINRRSTLALSNGVNVQYVYDNDSRTTGITYKFNTNTLGNLAYSYDTLGRRTQVGGSFAQTGLPSAVSSNSYDAANELTNWNGTSISYDPNGNMLADGSNTFVWNARHQVSTLNNVNLKYDAFGRRTRNLNNTSFLFDGANSVQELSGAIATANVIGGGIDEIFTRADSGGSYTPLKDALNSTIAVIDANGNVVASYAYDPFGGTTISGANSNLSQYTGRENEANGLYYYRARYYSPRLGRFISQDPLGFAAGVNSYAYVSDSPTNLKDATGLGGGVPVPSEIFAGRKENQKWWKDFWHAFWYEPYSSKYTCRTYPESWCIGNEKRLGQIGIVPHYDTMILAAPAVAAVDEVVGEEAADLAGTAIADGSVEGAHDVALFHQGNLGEGVSAGRSLSTSFDSDLAHYHPEGQLYTFRVPEEVYNEWLSRGLVQKITDMHAGTGIVTQEIRILPPASGQMNQYLVH